MPSKSILATLTLGAVLAVAGCASDDTDTGPTTTGPAPTTTGAGPGGPGQNGTDPGTGGNGTIEDRSCTAVSGGTGSGYAGVPGGYVGGCPFGAATESRTLVVSANLPSECDLFYAEDDNLNAQPANVGETYAAGTSFSMFCEPGVNLAGTIQLQAL